MYEFRTVVVLAAVTIVVTGGLMVLSAISPYAALGLAPVLTAIAMIIRAIRGSKDAGRR